MIKRVNKLSKKEKIELSNKITESFFNYPYDNNLGMKEYLDKKHFSYYIRAFIEEAIKDHSLYATMGMESFMVLVTPETKTTFIGAFLSLFFGFKAYKTKFFRHLKEIDKSGEYLSNAFIINKEPYISIELIVTLEEYKNKGYMKELMEYAINEKNKRNIPLYLITDSLSKVDIYKHFSFELVKEHKITNNASYYEMIKR